MRQNTNFWTFWPMKIIQLSFQKPTKIIFAVMKKQFIVFHSTSSLPIVGQKCWSPTKVLGLDFPAHFWDRVPFPAKSYMPTPGGEVYSNQKSQKDLIFVGDQHF